MCGSIWWTLFSTFLKNNRKGLVTFYVCLPGSYCVNMSHGPLKLFLKVSNLFFFYKEMQFRHKFMELFTNTRCSIKYNCKVLFVFYAHLPGKQGVNVQSRLFMLLMKRVKKKVWKFYLQWSLGFNNFMEVFTNIFYATKDFISSWFLSSSLK